MTSPIKVPALGESITEAVVAAWRVKVGDAVAVDQPLVELETDKITVEVPAPAAGVIREIRAAPGAKVNVGDIIGEVGDALSSGTGTSAPAPTASPIAYARAGRGTIRRELPVRAASDGGRSWWKSRS